MPIVDVTWVGTRPAVDALGKRLALAAAEALGSPPERTWVRMRFLDDADYAEAGAGDLPPVFVEVMSRAWPDDRSAVALRLTEALSAVCGRPSRSVHVEFAPPAGGRVAFGGSWVAGPERREASSGARWEATVGYRRAVRVGNHVWVSGTTALDPAGQPVGEDDAHAQAIRILETVEAALQAVGARLSDTVRTRMFVRDIARDAEAISRAHAVFFRDIGPASTMVEVARFIEPWMRVEIEVDAYVQTP